MTEDQAMDAGKAFAEAHLKVIEAALDVAHESFADAMRMLAKERSK